MQTQKLCACEWLDITATDESYEAIYHRQGATRKNTQTKYKKKKYVWVTRLTLYPKVRGGYIYIFFLSTGICTLGPSPISTLPRLKIWSTEKMKLAPTSIRSHPTDFIHKKSSLHPHQNFPLSTPYHLSKKTNYVTRRNCVRGSFRLIKE